MQARESSATPATQFYTWNGYRCAYSYQPAAASEVALPVLLVHPIGVGLSRRFWDRFCDEWQQMAGEFPLYNPDLLGCGDSALPRAGYRPEDWADQLAVLLRQVIARPALLVVQGASLAIALDLVARYPAWVRGLILAGPPAWSLMSEPTPDWQQRLLWNLFDSPFGRGFYRWARRRAFLHSFSERQLFARAEAVDAEWLDMLVEGASDPQTRHAVFAFLAGFWRRDYTEIVRGIAQPTLVVMGDRASSIARTGAEASPDQRLQDYLNRLPHGRGTIVSGRNVLPYESPVEFAQVCVEFARDVALLSQT